MRYRFIIVACADLHRFFQGTGIEYLFNQLLQQFRIVLETGQIPPEILVLITEEQYRQSVMPVRKIRELRFAESCFITCEVEYVIYDLEAHTDMIGECSQILHQIGRP